LLEGVPIRYGQPEPWKAIAQQIGRTKPSRTPQSTAQKRKKNDGRPPDTSRELLGHKRVKTESAAPTKKAILSPSYPWANNSCWLDTSLELLYQTVTRDFQDFSSRFAELHPETSLHTLYRLLDLRQLTNIDGGKEDLSLNLSQQRDNFRKHLHSRKLIKSITSFESLFVSASQMHTFIYPSG
jgi:hypothetical protein